MATHRNSFAFPFNLANDIMDDPKEPGLLKIGAFVVGSFAAGHGISDVVNHANGKPREWMIETSAEVPTREKVFGSVSVASEFLVFRHILHAHTCDYRSRSTETFFSRSLKEKVHFAGANYCSGAKVRTISFQYSLPHWLFKEITFHQRSGFEELGRARTLFQTDNVRKRMLE